MGRLMFVAGLVSAMGLGGCSDDKITHQGSLDASIALDAALETNTSQADGPVDAAVPPERLRSFYTTFEGALAPQVNIGSCELQPTQGYAGVGRSNNMFASTFLWCPVQKEVVVTLSLLAPHTSIDIAFLFAAIDSLDGTSEDGTGDFLSVSLDGQTLFRQSFANSLFIEAFTNKVTDSVQGYLPPPGVQLKRKVDLGFRTGAYWLDSAYDLGLDPALTNIPHSSATATIVFALGNPHLMAFDDDESWAVDNIRITVGDSPRSPIDAGFDSSMPDGSSIDAR